MDHIGIDVHKNASQVCIRTETGQLIIDKNLYAPFSHERHRAILARIGG